MASQSASQQRDAEHQAAVRNYQALCLAALAVLALVLLQHGYHGRLSLLLLFLTLLVGLIGIVTRLSLAPLLFLVALLFQSLVGSWHRESLYLGDLLECAAVLAYVAGQFRLQGLVRFPGPPDPREQRFLRDQQQPAAPARRRAAPRELPLLLIATVAWAGLAQVVWAVLPDDWYYLGVQPPVWRLILITWTGGLALVVGAGFVNYLARESMTSAEATLFLQDGLWSETRGEQRQANRWLAWSRLRYQRRLAAGPRSKE